MSKWMTPKKFRVGFAPPSPPIDPLLVTYSSDKILLPQTFLECNNCLEQL